MALAIRAFAAGLERDRAGARTYPPPANDFEWFISRIAENLVATRPLTTMEEAVKQFPKIASDFAKLQMQSGGGDKALLARGLQHGVEKRHAAAVADLAEYLGANPGDWTTRFYYGVALTNANNFERARRELSLVLCGNSALFEGYCQRAIAAARMGDLTRARKDLALARQLDAKNQSWLPGTEKAVAEAAAMQPSGPASRWADNVLAAARKGQSLEQLTPIAEKLVRTAHASRLNGIEVYQDKLRRLQWSVIAAPKDATRQAALGQFLFDENDVRGEYVDPGKHYVHYRPQTRSLKAVELQVAGECFQRALGIDSLHLPALTGMAQLKYQENLFGDAEKYVRQALAVPREDPVVLDLMSRLKRIAQGQEMARAISAATPVTWTEPLANGWERRVTILGDPVAADRHSRNADALVKQGEVYARRALQACKDTPESYDYLGTLAAEKKQFATMRDWYERAVQKRPDHIEYRYALANAYSALGDHEKYLEHATAGRNLEQTSIGAYLLAAWRAILQSDWTRARDFVVRASRIDSADSRVAAYLGVIAEGQNQLPEAAACFRAAVAIEEANGKHRGAAHGVGSPASLLEEVGRLVALRIRLARLIEESDPAGALALYERNLEMESRLTSPEMIALSLHVEGRIQAETKQLQARNHPMIRPIVDAMLPEPARTSAQQSRPPDAAGLLQVSRSLAGVALYRLGRKPEAAEHFRRVDDYAKYTGAPRGGTRAMTVTGIWTPRPVADIAAACLREMGDPPSSGRGQPAKADPLPGRPGSSGRRPQ
jgi:tetratricopeptide (TPR) repeat protein